MANPLPLRILIAGGSLNDREQVGSFLRAHQFSVLEAHETYAHEPFIADAVVMIEPVSEQPVVQPAASVTPEMTPLVLVTKSPTIAEQASAQVIAMSNLIRLPGLIADVVEARRGSMLSEHAIALRAIRESQRLIATGRLLAEIAHEINNPLESVGNLLYLALHEAGMPAQAIDFLHTAERELQRVVQISKQTLSFSRESSEPVAIQLAEVMDEVVAMYGRRIRQKNLSVTREYASSQSVVAFPGEIRQVISNLVTNAIEASSDGGKLRLRVRDTVRYGLENATSGVRITIGDNGSGIPESARKRLGEIFFTTKGETGNGLGLWVTNAIVARYGGTMRLRSRTGERHGSIFSIFLPPVSTTVMEPVEGTESRETEGNDRENSNVTEISRHPRYGSNSHGLGLQGTCSSGSVSTSLPSMPRQREG